MLYIIIQALKVYNPNDARFGDVQYLSDILPSNKTPAQLSRRFIGNSFQWKNIITMLKLLIE